MMYQTWLRKADPAYWPITIAVPNALDSGTIPLTLRAPDLHASSDKEVKAGMVMALSLSERPSNERLMVVSAYESKHVIVHVQQSNTVDRPWSWKKVLVSQPHSQPLLSLDVSPTADFFFASSVDTVISKFAIPTNTGSSEVAEKPYKTKHAGQQGLGLRSDSKMFATAGWDARMRAYSVKMMREL